MDKDFTKEFYAEQKAIIEKYGKPVYKPEPNESAKLIKAAKQRENYEKNKAKKSMELQGRLEKVEAQVGRGTEMPRLVASEVDLRPFDPTEQSVIKAFLANTLLSHGEIAAALENGITSQRVTAVLNAQAAKDLIKRLMHENLDAAVWKAFSEGVARGDNKFISLAFDHGIGLDRIKKEDEKLRIFGLTPEQEDMFRIIGNWITGQDYTLILKPRIETEDVRTFEALK